jgi:hypothetical protein
MMDEDGDCGDEDGDDCGCTCGDEDGDEGYNYFMILVFIFFINKRGRN